MQVTYVENCAYDIIACGKDESPMLQTPMTKAAITNLRKKYPGKLEAALNKLSSGKMCGGEDMKPAEYRNHLAKCFIPGTIAAKIKYRLGGYARVSLTMDHELSDQENHKLDDALEGQMTDGYGENDFELFSADGLTYWLTI